MHNVQLRNRDAFGVVVTWLTIIFRYLFSLIVIGLTSLFEVAVLPTFPFVTLFFVLTFIYPPLFT